MDEYTSEIFMGGKNTIVMHNTCEDSLLAAPIILDLVLLAELSTRIQFKSEGEVRQFTVHVILGSLFSLNRGFDVLKHLFGRESFTLSILWPPYSATSPRHHLYRRELR